MATTKTPEYNTMLFSDIYDDEDKFLSDYTSLPMPQTITEQSAIIVFYLLYGQYGNNPISNMDVHQFKIKLFNIIWQYGPSWEARLSIQSKVRELTDEELVQGSKSIFNHSFNPSTAPSTSSTEELPTIDDQNTSFYRKSKLEGLQIQWSMIKSDVTKEFVDRFKILFKKFVAYEEPLLYVTEEEEI